MEIILSYLFCEMGLQESTKIVIISISVWDAYTAVCTVAYGIVNVSTAEAKLWSGEAPAVIYFTVTQE